MFNKIVDSIEAELSAIALALEASFEYLIQLDHPNTVEQLFIFTDCKRAIDCIINRSQMNIYHCVLARVTVSGRLTDYDIATRVQFIMETVRQDNIQCNAVTSCRDADSSTQ